MLKLERDGMYEATSGPLEALFHDSDLLKHPAPVIYMDTYRHISYFLIALGCQNGLVKVLKYTPGRVWDKEPLVTLQLDGPIASTLFCEFEPGITDLVIAPAVGYIVIAKEVISKEFGTLLIIPDAAKDAITCAAVLDIDFDGYKELIIGTYDNEILAYKYRDSAFSVLWTMKFMHPVMCLRPLDINKDGVIELVVISMFGIYVLAPSHRLALQKILAIRQNLES